MRDLHPDVKMVFDAARELRERIDNVRDRVTSIVARRPSPSGAVIPEVDAFGRLRELFLVPGTCVRFGNDELVAEIMAAVTASFDDARRQYDMVMHDRKQLPRPLADVMRERWGDRGSG